METVTNDYGRFEITEIPAKGKSKTPGVMVQWIHSAGGVKRPFASRKEADKWIENPTAKK